MATRMYHQHALLMVVAEKSCLKTGMPADYIGEWMCEGDSLAVYYFVSTKINCR